MREEQKRRLDENKEGVIGEAKIRAMFARLRNLLQDFWNRARQLFAGSTKGIEKLRAEDFADMALADLLKGVDPRGRSVRNDVQPIFQRGGEVDIEAVNAKFNEELEKQIKGELPKGHVYDMGMPGEILRSTGFPNVPIEMSASHLAMKAGQERHPFALADVKDLVKALSHPVVVFTYGDKGKAQNVIVEIQHDGKNFVVGIHFNQKKGSAEVSSIRGLFPKDNHEWLNWIEQGKALYIDKEKVQAIINQQQMIPSGVKNAPADVEYIDLNSIAKIVKEFENPEINLQGVEGESRVDNRVDRRDREYAAAVEAGDIEKAQRMVNEAAEEAGYVQSDDYKMSHRAPAASVEREGFTNIEAMAEIAEETGDINLFAVANGVSLVPEDYFSIDGPRLYGYDDAEGRESLYALRDAIDEMQRQVKEHGEVVKMPKVKVYRAVPKDIKAWQLERGGQWVTPSREYAKSHGQNVLGLGKYRIIEQEVPADELWWDGNDIREWGYDDGTNNAYKNTKNNRKLLDAATYDDNGELIPLSKRFNARKSDVRYSKVEDGEEGVVLRGGEDDYVPRVAVRESYERQLSRASFQFTEAVQDSMLSLKKLQETIQEAYGEKELKSFEDAYMAENRMSSMTNAQTDLWHKTYMLFWGMMVRLSGLIWLGSHF